MNKKVVREAVIYGTLLAAGIYLAPTVAAGTALAKGLDVIISHSAGKFGEAAKESGKKKLSSIELLWSDQSRKISIEALQTIIRALRDDKTNAFYNKAHLTELEKAVPQIFEFLSGEDTFTSEEIKSLLSGIKESEEFPRQSAEALVALLCEQSAITTLDSFTRSKLIEQIEKRFLTVMMTLTAEKMARGETEGFLVLLQKINLIQVSGEEAKKERGTLINHAQETLKQIGSLHDLIHQIRWESTLRFDSLDDANDQILTLLGRNIPFDPLPSISINKTEDFNQTDLNYRYEWLDFIGRHEEQKQLQDFIFQEENFLWWAIVGDGGVGKSRLAQKFRQDLILRGWHAGMIARGDVDWLRNHADKYLSTAPTLIIIDYAAGLSTDIPEVLRKFHAKSVEYEFPIRLLFLDRRGTLGAWFREIGMKTSLLDEGLTISSQKSIYTPEGIKPPDREIEDHHFLQLDPPGEDEWAEYIRTSLTKLKRSDQLPPDGDPFWKSLGHLTANGRPLYLQAAAILLAEQGAAKFDAQNKNDLLRGILKHEIGNRWTVILKDRDEDHVRSLKRCIGYITLCRGLDLPNGWKNLCDATGTIDSTNLRDDLRRLLRSEDITNPAIIYPAFCISHIAPFQGWRYLHIYPGLRPGLSHFRLSACFLHKLGLLL